MYTGNQALRALIDAVKAKGHTFCYQQRPKSNGQNITGCWYVYDDCPDCLIGDALFRLGVPIDKLKEFEGCSTESTAFAGRFDLSLQARDLFNEAQLWQDASMPWGSCLIRAAGIASGRYPDEFDRELLVEAYDVSEGRG